MDIEQKSDHTSSGNKVDFVLNIKVCWDNINLHGDLLICCLVAPTS